MITPGGGATKIHLPTEPIDLRRGYGGLYTLVEQHFGAEPMCCSLWVFTNGRSKPLDPYRASITKWRTRKQVTS